MKLQDGDYSMGEIENKPFFSRGPGPEHAPWCDLFAILVLRRVSIPEKQQEKECGM